MFTEHYKSVPSLNLNSVPSPMHFVIVDIAENVHLFSKGMQHNVIYLIGTSLRIDSPSQGTMRISQGSLIHPMHTWHISERGNVHPQQLIPRKIYLENKRPVSEDSRSSFELVNEQFGNKLIDLGMLQNVR